MGRDKVDDRIVSAWHWDGSRAKRDRLQGRLARSARAGLFRLRRWEAGDGREGDPWPCHWKPRNVRYFP